MANHTSSKKKIRKDAARTAVNVQRVGRIRTFLKKVEQAIAGGDKATANAALRTAESELMSGVSKGVFKLNTAARKVSRLSKRIKALG